MTTTTRTLPKGENEKTRASERVTGKKEAKKIKVERGLPLSLFFFAEATCETRGRYFFFFFGTRQSFSLSFTQSLGPLSTRVSACDGSEAGFAEEAAGAS